MKTDTSANDTSALEMEAAASAIRAQLFDELAPIPVYARAIRKSERSVWNYIAQGLPVVYIGRTPHVAVGKSCEFWANRRRIHETPKRGRPAKRSAA